MSTVAEGTALADYLTWLTTERGRTFPDYESLWRWSIEDLDGFWTSVWDRFGVRGSHEAVLGNRDMSGARLGTAEFYTVVEELPEVTDSLVVHLEDPEGEAGQLILFVTLFGGGTLDDALRGRICAALRAQLSPRHVPDVIEAVAAIPRTLTGKKLETPIKQILLGRAAYEVISRDSVSDFAAVTIFKSFAADLPRVGAR